MQRTDGTAEPREQRVDWFFVCDAWRGEPTILEPHKCAELAWFDLDGLPERVPDYETLALDAIRGGRTSTLLSYGF
jgi:ADP-ribose pyrophosphatase YjhB (NUDIX family)